jgi:hypothetical protein
MVPPRTQAAGKRHKRPRAFHKLRQVPTQFSWVEQRLGRERSLAQLSPHAGALSLFLVTVADAQGLSSYADASLGQRLSRTSPELHQARQALIPRGLVAYQRPLSQGFARAAASQEVAPSAAPGGADDAPVDIQAAFARSWEGLS